MKVVTDDFVKKFVENCVSSCERFEIGQCWDHCLFYSVKTKLFLKLDEYTKNNKLVYNAEGNIFSESYFSKMLIQPKLYIFSISRIIIEI